MILRTSLHLLHRADDVRFSHRFAGDMTGNRRNSFIVEADES
jgi:hypothetical protein